MFIGREKELKFLQDKYNEKKGQMIVLYGRRRVLGKRKLSENFASTNHIFSIPVRKVLTEYN